MFSQIGSKLAPPAASRWLRQARPATDASIAPITQNPWVGMNSCPAFTGCDPENWLNANCQPSYEIRSPRKR